MAEENRGRQLIWATPVTAFQLRTRLIEVFRQVWSQTPHIPDEFIDTNWRRSKATTLFNELADTLNGGASAYFAVRW